MWKVFLFPSLSQSWLMFILCNIILKNIDAFKCFSAATKRNLTWMLNKFKQWFFPTGRPSHNRCRWNVPQIWVTSSSSQSGRLERWALCNLYNAGPRCFILVPKMMKKMIKYLSFPKKTTSKHCILNLFLTFKSPVWWQWRRFSVMRHLLTDGAELDELGRFQESLIFLFLSFQKHNLKKTESWRETAKGIDAVFVSLLGSDHCPSATSHKMMYDATQTINDAVKWD